LAILKVAHIFGLLFPTVKVMHLHIMAKNGLGHILGEFLTNSSGHPARHYSLRLLRGFKFPSQTCGRLTRVCVSLDSKECLYIEFRFTYGGGRGGGVTGQPATSLMRALCS
jgi:hypothetical protein